MRLQLTAGAVFVPDQGPAVLVVLAPRTCVTVWPLPNVRVTVQDFEVPVPAFVTVTCPWKPPGQFAVALHVAVQAPRSGVGDAEGDVDGDRVGQGEGGGATRSGAVKSDVLPAAARARTLKYPSVTRCVYDVVAVVATEAKEFEETSSPRTDGPGHLGGGVGTGRVEIVRRSAARAVRLRV